MILFYRGQSISANDSYTVHDPKYSVKPIRTFASHNAITSESMSPSRRRAQSLRVDLPEGATQERPRIAAAFLIYFDVKAGYARPNHRK